MTMIPNHTQREQQGTAARGQDNKPINQTVAPCPGKASTSHPAAPDSPPPETSHPTAPDSPPPGQQIRS